MWLDLRRPSTPSIVILRARRADRDDDFAKVKPMLDWVLDFAALLAEGGEAGYAGPRASEGSGRPVATPNSSPASNGFSATPSPAAPGRKPAGRTEELLGLRLSRRITRTRPQGELHGCRKHIRQGMDVREFRGRTRICHYKTPERR